jgi:extracellular matrix regulatory protein B
MFLHIGSEYLLQNKEIVAIIGWQEGKKGVANNVFLNRIGKTGEIIKLTSGTPKSFVVATDERVYFSPISPQTLTKRGKILGLTGGEK